MYQPIIDSHIHLDWYKEEELDFIFSELEDYQIESLIAVSSDLCSARKNVKLAQAFPFIKPAFGFHPEQKLPKEEELNQLEAFIKANHEQMVAIGEVGLPYYLRQDDTTIPLKSYLELLERFVQLATKYHKPIVLHAVYSDATIVCDLLEKYEVKRAHFHWFKGDPSTVERMIYNEYVISITPDVLYEAEIRKLVIDYPLSLMMVETDGPWPFEGIFKNERTHPKMTHKVIKEIAKLKQMDRKEVYNDIYNNTKSFYCI